MSPHNNDNDSNNNNNSSIFCCCCSYWTYFSEDILVQQLLKRFVLTLSQWAVQYPRGMIVSITAMSFLLIVSGFVTNFEIIYNHQEIFTPIGSLSEQHYQWITQQSGFQQIRPFYVMVHKDGNNVLANATSTIQTVFDVISVLETTPGYDNVCTPSTTTTTTTSILCPWSSPTQYWNHSKKIFHDELQLFGGESEEEQNEYVIRTLSQSTFPDKTPVFHEALLGNYEYQQEPPTVVDDDDDNGDDDNDDTFTTFDISNTSTKMNNSNATSVRSLQSTSQTLLRPSQETTTTITIVSAQSYTVKIDLPNLGIQSEELEQRMLMRMNDMMQQQSTLSSIKVEYFTMYAYTLEFEKAVYSDIYLVFVMILIMVTFCCGVFWNRQDRIQSRSMVGLFSITTIGMSLLSGYGLMWLLAVPFTNISMMVPFVIMGIGLDDTFIITGAYFRCRLRHQHDDHKNNQRASSVPATNNSRDNDTDNNRRNIGSKKGQQDLFLGTIIAETMDEVGLSICLTTITTMVAFALGIIISSIPAVRWLCIYGFTCIGIDFIYQITFFVALLVMDEKRIMANRYDCCWWTVQPEEEQDNDNGENDNVVVDDHQHEHEHEGDDVQRKNRVTENKSISPEATNYNSKCDNDNENNNKNFSERFMGWYADQLLRPITKACVLTFFTVFLGGCVFSTTLLTQEFKVESYVPRGSHVKTFFESFENYSSLFQAIGVYFRDVDQSDPVIQQQMMDYVANLSQMQQIGGEPPQFFWLRDFADTMSNAAPDQNLDLVANMTFEQRMDFILSIPEVSTVYGKDIVRDPTTGEITASRCFLHLRNIDMDSVPDQIDTLLDQRVITRAQPINDKKNQGAPRFSFFTFDDLYFYWELYAASIDELIFTIITGAVAVSAVAFVLIPHWSATLFVTPLIIALYFMLLGSMQVFGIHINAVTYVIIVMAIGLLVDFLMHILLRYYETPGKTRHEKVKETLETMGASILLGGLTTLLGVIPLAFSTATIFMVVFKSFLAMVCLGCGVGLILLPVLLSLVGPIVTKQHGSLFDAEAKAESQDQSSPSGDNDMTRLQTSSSSEDKNGSNESSALQPSLSLKDELSSDDINRIRLVMTSSTGGGYEAV